MAPCLDPFDPAAQCQLMNKKSIGQSQSNSWCTAAHPLIERMSSGLETTRVRVWLTPELQGGLRCLQRRNIIKEAVKPTFRSAGPGCAEILSDYG